MEMKRQSVLMGPVEEDVLGEQGMIASKRSLEKQKGQASQGAPVSQSVVPGQKLPDESNQFGDSQPLARSSVGPKRTSVMLGQMEESVSRRSVAPVRRSLEKHEEEGVSERSQQGAPVGQQLSASNKREGPVGSGNLSLS